VITLPKPGKGSKIPQNLLPIRLSTTGKLFVKITLNLNQRHVEVKNLVNASKFGFHARHSMTL
jgi:hypothetical protein